MSWPSPRPSYTNLSIHQTLLGKALYEHGDTSLVARVAASSSSIRNSSLGPNLVALIFAAIDAPRNLFAKVFTADSTLQFVQTLNLDCRFKSADEFVVGFLTSLKKTPYFSRSVQNITLNFPTNQILGLLKDLVYLRHLNLHGCETCVTSASVKKLGADAETGTTWTDRVVDWFSNVFIFSFFRLSEMICFFGNSKTTFFV